MILSNQSSTSIDTMKFQLILIYALCFFVSAHGKLQALEEFNTLHTCLHKFVEDAIDAHLPLIYVLTNDDFSTIPKQHEKPYFVIDAMQNMTFSIGTQYVIFLDNDENLETILKMLKLKISWKKAPKCKILIATRSTNVEFILTELWLRKIINVAIIHHSTIYTSNPFHEKNQCGKIPILISAQNCTSSPLRFEQYKNFYNCPVEFVSYFRKNEYDHIINVVSLYIMEQLEKSFNTTVMFNTQSKVLKDPLVIMFFLDRVHKTWDEITFFSDDAVWITPLTDITVFNFYTSMTWWAFTCVQTVACPWNHFCLSVLNVWCLTLCGCIKTPPTVRHLKSIFFLYLFFVIVIQAAFKSNLIKAITVPKFESDMKTIKDVANSKLPLTTFSVVEELFFKKRIPESDLYTKISEKVECSYRGLEDSILYKNCSHVSLRYILEMFKTSTNLKPNYFADNSATGTYKASIGLAKGHFFTESLQNLRLTLIESGVYSKVIYDFYHEHQWQLDEDEKSYLVILTFRHLHLTFSLWGIGLIIATVVFLIENITLRFRS
ncbi:hypothetical protein FQR65_LT00170 [Abscondita terminalis]|nr:hypothetical protein FQR65_LT00170 [Abscondita terminalis]